MERHNLRRLNVIEGIERKKVHVKYLCGIHHMNLANFDGILEHSRTR
jgi:hypothetical protein